MTTRIVLRCCARGTNENSRSSRGTKQQIELATQNIRATEHWQPRHAPALRQTVWPLRILFTMTGGHVNWQNIIINQSYTYNIIHYETRLKQIKTRTFTNAVTAAVVFLQKVLYIHTKTNGCVTLAQGVPCRAMLA